MTIGYGAPTNDIFYGGCSSMATLLTLEVRCRLTIQCGLCGVYTLS